MALPISITDLLNKRKVESNRIEFKSGWNPDKIYHTICAFANDLDNLGGGYILVGVEEEDGVAKRPVKGISASELDKIQKDMIGFNNKIEPYYMPRIEIEEVDGQYIMAIWVPTGAYRPYCVAESVVSKHSVPKWYIRSGSSSIEAKGEILDELRDSASRIPFDERGNANIELDDISPLLLAEHLRKVGSKLALDFQKRPIEETLEQMDLYVGPTERRMIKNVAAMMFCENPEKYFPITRVEIVIFPEGRLNNPNNMIEIPRITGSVPYIIKQTLDYLRVNVVQERIIKVSDKEEAIKFFNYPYAALEEGVANALYHRDYQEREPVEITIEPDMITILSFSGPDRSVSLEAVREGKKLKARRYRNRRLGEFLKELDLTEGHATGIPTIQDEMKKNGSAPARFETDEDRTYFLVEYPCREGFEDIIYVNTAKPLKEDRTKKILDFCKIPKSRKEIFEMLGVSNQSKNFKNIIEPLLKDGSLSMTNPDNPKCRNQKYMTVL